MDQFYPNLGPWLLCLALGNCYKHFSKILYIDGIQQLNISENNIFKHVLLDLN